MRKLEQETFVCIDCETTGLDTNVDRIIEVAVVRFTFNEILEQFESLIDPEGPISEASIEIHHITPDMVKGEPKIREVLPQVLRMIGNSYIIGHGVKFDVEMLANAADRAGIPCTIRNNQIIDTLRLARLYGDSPSNGLEILGKHFNVASDGAHRAMSDVNVNIEVFKHLSKRYGTLQKMLQVLSKPILLKTMPLGKHKGRNLREIPLQYLNWATRLDFDQDLMYSIREEIKRRKSGNLFQQVGNPFSNL